MMSHQAGLLLDHSSEMALRQILWRDQKTGLGWVGRQMSRCGGNVEKIFPDQ